MSISTITANGQSVNVVALPTPAVGTGVGTFHTVEWSFADAVALVVSPYTGQTQAQQWFGADMWSGVMTLPPMVQANFDAWAAFMMELRGMANAMLLGDPLKATPRGNVSGSPAIPGTVTDVAGQQYLSTVGWTPTTGSLLLPGDYIQVGYRLHRVLDAVTSNGSGNASIPIWPSLREAPVASSALITSNCVGLFRRAQNKGTWSADITRLSRMSIPVMEYR